METIVSKVSHDARNSLRALTQVPEWIKDDLEEGGIVIPEDVTVHLNMMVTHARRLENMVADLTTFARAGQSHDAQVIDLDRCIDEVIQAMNVPDGFSVICDLECDTVQIAKADMVALLKALISNGIKHHHLDIGQVHIETRTADGACMIVVRDDGPGIATVDRSRIFDAMTTLRPRDDVEGSGLGLAIVMKIINHYDGFLDLKDGSDGTGCVFSVKLPRSVEGAH